MWHGCVCFLFFIVFGVFGGGFCVMVVACWFVFCWGFVVDWKSAAVERGRLAEIAKIDRELYRLYHVVTDLWTQRELIELSLRGGDR